MDTLDYLRKNFKDIFSTYKIPVINKSELVDEICGTLGTRVLTQGAAITPNKLGSLLAGTVLLSKGIPKFTKTNPDIYPLIIKYCDRAGLKESELYTKALVNKASFSKIRTMKDTGYKPSKSTILCLCLTLHLNIKETEEMLKIVGYALSNESLVDKVVYWCLENNCYDFEEVDLIITENGGGDYRLLPNL